MLQTWIHRIKPGQEERLRAWLAELNMRSDEVREALTDAGIRGEQAFILPEPDSLLIYVSEADDPARANAVFAASTRPIDVQHRQVLTECIAETLTEAPVYDVIT
jgi:hypothetical protein